jgi:hypothetical protein
MMLGKSTTPRWLWLTLLIGVSLVMIMAIEESKTILTIFGVNINKETIVAFIIGIIATIVAQILAHYVAKFLNRPPKKIFKTHFGYSIKDMRPELDKKLILNAGDTYTFCLFVGTAKVCEDIKRIGVRPQMDKPFCKRLFRNYNEKTKISPRIVYLIPQLSSGQLEI